MSGIASIGSSNMYPSFLSSMSGPGGQAALGKSFGMDPQSMGFGMNPEQMETKRNSMLDQVESMAVNAGLDSESIAALRDELETTLATAMDQVRSGGGVADPREAVRDAVSETLAKYGIESKDLKAYGAAGGEGPEISGAKLTETRGSIDLSLFSAQGQSTENSLLMTLLDSLRSVDVYA